MRASAIVKGHMTSAKKHHPIQKQLCKKEGESDWKNKVMNKHKIKRSSVQITWCSVGSKGMEGF